MIPMQQMAALMTQSGSAVLLTVSSNQNKLNLFTLAGSPAAAGTYVVTVNSGITIYSDDTGTAALTVGAFPAGSTVRIVNNGDIIGMGGNGGGTTLSATSAGSPGGNAIQLSTGYAVEIDNTSGNIWGGGGGGGAGRWGNGNALGGTGGGGASSNQSPSARGTLPGGYGPNTAADGNRTGGGNGGDGLNDPCVGDTGQPGGAGGTHGAAGNSGSGSAAGPTGSRSGGAAGKAINLNGNSVTWLGGNNGTQVKGAES
jgi:hypothetical protein